MYALIPNAPSPITNPTKPLAQTHVDVVIGAIELSSITKRDKPLSTSTTNSYNPTLFAEVNAIQSSQSPKNKKEKVKIRNLETIRRVPKHIPQRMMKNLNGRLSILAYCVEIITS